MAKEDKSQWFSPMQQLIGDVDKQEIMEGNLKNILDMDNHKIIEGRFEFGCKYNHTNK